MTFLFRMFSFLQKKKKKKKKKNVHGELGTNIPTVLTVFTDLDWLRGTGGHGFDPRPRHTKVVKNGTSCSSLGTQIYGVELGLVDPVSG